MKWFRFFLIIGLITTIGSWVVPLGATQSEDQIIHTVLSGENLYRISLRYGVTMDAIRNRDTGRNRKPRLYGSVR